MKYLKLFEGFDKKKYKNIPKIVMSKSEFKQKVSLSSQTQDGIFLNKMNLDEFEIIIGSENVINNKIKVYRGVPNDISSIRNGDYVTINEEYAYKYSDKVISFEVPLNKLRYNGRGHKNGDPQMLHLNQPTELIYVEKVDWFSKAFKSFEYDKYCKFVSNNE